MSSGNQNYSLIVTGLLEENCVDDVTVTQDQTVDSGTIDLRQAKQTLTASNTINNGATAIYDAGTRIPLKDGLKASSGSFFKAYIEGCSLVSNIVKSAKREVVRYGPNEINHSQEGNLLNIQNEPTLQKKIPSEIQLYPNPTQGTLHLRFLGEIPATATVQMYDMVGNLVYSQQVIKNTHADHQLDISRLQSGIYLIKILNEKQVLVSRQLIKQ